MCDLYLLPSLSGGVLLARKPPGFPSTLMPEALGQGRALLCSLPSSDTSSGLSDWLWDFWCPVSPKSKARRQAVWLQPEPGEQ